MVLLRAFRRLVLTVVVAGGAWLVWTYAAIYGRPADMFEPRDHSSAQLYDWKQDCLAKFGRFESDLASRRTARMEISDSAVNSLLLTEGAQWAGRLGLPVPPEVRDAQVVFHPGLLIVRFEYVHPDVERVVVSWQVRPEKLADGSWRMELDEVRIGRQWVPKEPALRRFREHLGGLGDGPAADGEPMPIGRHMLASAASGTPIGPVVRLPRLPGSKTRLDVRLHEFRVEEGKLTVEVEPVNQAPIAPGKPAG